MLSSGDVVDVDLAVPTGSEAGLLRPAVVVTAQRVLTRQPTVVQVVPLTRTLRGYETEAVIAADDDNGRTADSAAQCIGAIAHSRVRERPATLGPRRSPRSATLWQFCSTHETVGR